MLFTIRLLVTWYIFAMTSCTRWGRVEAGEECVSYPVMCSNEAPGFYQKCSFNSDQVKCSYTPVELEERGSVSDTEPVLGFVEILTPRIYRTDLNHRISCLSRAVNISWLLTPNDSWSGMLRGFLLTLSHEIAPFGEDEMEVTPINSHGVPSYTKSESRFFNVTFLRANDTSATMFYYDCLTVDPSIAYTITVTSLTSGGVAGEGGGVSTMSFTTSDFKNSYTIPPPENSGLWITMSWASPRPSVGAIAFCFFAAPDSYGFTSYLIQLVDSASLILNNIHHEEIVPAVSITGDGKICRTFQDVCPGIYKAYVSAVNVGGCLCRVEGRCVNHCARSELSPLDMSAGRKCATGVSLEDTTKTGASSLEILTSDPIVISGDYMTPGTDPGKVAKLVAAGVGSGLALALIALLAAMLCMKKKNKKNNKGRSPPPGDSGKSNEKSNTIDHKMPILIVYSRDNETHRQVVCRFAVFLQAHCCCDVIIDEWPNSREAISQLGRAQWLHQQIQSVSHILLVHSVGTRKRYEGRLTGVRYEGIDDVMLDLFIPSVTLLQEHFLHSTNGKKLFEVYFPYTSGEDVIDLKLGGGDGGRSGRKAYCLMLKLDELFLNIHKLTKYNDRGKADLRLINVEEYDACSEGKLLKEAIAMAVDYHRHHRDWFERLHRVVTYKPDNTSYRKELGFSQHDDIKPPTLGRLSDDSDSLHGASLRNKNPERSVVIRISPEADSISKEFPNEETQSRDWREEDIERNNNKVAASLSTDDTGEISEKNFDSGLGSLRSEAPDEFYIPRLRRMSSSMTQLDAHRLSLNSSSCDSNFTCIPPDDMDDGSSLHSSQYRRFVQGMNDSVSLGEFSGSSLEEVGSAVDGEGSVEGEGYVRSGSPAEEMRECGHNKSSDIAARLRQHPIMNL